MVCIAENDACGVDAIQVLLGCSVGKGNLALSPPGQAGAFSFYNRKTAARRRCAAGAPPPLRRSTRPRRERFRYLQDAAPASPFRREARRAVPAGEGPALPVPPLRRLRRGDGGAPAPAGEREKSCAWIMPPGLTIA
ncbi:MAG: FmdE family protein [Flavonifractor plautii]